MHRLIQSEIEGNVISHLDNRTTIAGLAIAIEPPVGLNPEVVSRYIVKGTLDTAQEHQKSNPFAEAYMVGSSDDRTVILARFFEKQATEGSSVLAEGRLRLASCVSNLLGAIGIIEVEWDKESPDNSLTRLI